jgi:hypothetical protein
MRRSLLLISFAALVFSTAARADLSISNKPTQNMSCDAGLCVPTAKKAVLNIGDLQAMLASGDVAVTTGSVAKDIEIAQRLLWSSTSRLTLDAQQSVIVKKQITVAGTGALTVIINDTGQRRNESKTGEYVIVPEHGSVQFWDLGSSLIINGSSYTLLNDIKTLAADIATDPSGSYALARSYDASGDGTYTSRPVSGTFTGVFEGLGNEFSNVSINISSNESLFGFFEQIGDTGVLRDVGLKNISLVGAGSSWGALAGQNFGIVEGCWARGSIGATAIAVGGLIADNDGLILRSVANVDVTSSRHTGTRWIGGLAAGNAGLISQSFSRGRVDVSGALASAGGGLVGFNADGGRIVDSYSVSKVHSGRDNCCKYGGLIGENSKGASVANSYAAGAISQGHAQKSLLGGLVGFVDGRRIAFNNTYWDLDKGVSNPARGAGNKKNDPGITGLSDAQLKAALPSGLDPKIWGQSPSINNGYPYLLANPPQ